ncbi:Ger(x)C family spore germination protein [Fervidibacillus halotolerans]|uniref:Ger(X)C family spore germination protein n=1 Tax=Fervidibacillus halotolerans TaxID=2980027 RepID=A0A9E8LY88_9BACI|nr:Ger(x)C family spore germination protein [Fervidibacillus halotolerans]WAA11935.1 Ger(x)C family spore germination protein [Fervidibacillus halotolerans]
MKQIQLITLLFFFLLLSGCVEREILDEIILMEGIGFDYVEGGDITGTILYPDYKKETEPENVTYSATGEIMKTILQDIERQAARPIAFGSLEIVIFDLELAKKRGILDLIDAFQRDPAIGSGIYLAISENKAKELFKGEYGLRGNARFISMLIDHNIRHEDLPKTNLQRFMGDFYQQGKTPYLPLIKQNSKTKIELSGVALLKYGKIVDVVSNEQSFFFKLLADKYSNGLHRVEVDGKEAAVQSIISTNRFELTSRDPLHITVHIKIGGTINEFTGNKLTDSFIKKIEKKFEKEIQKHCTQLIKRFQEKEIDPIGFGHFVKSKTRNFDFNQWWDSEYSQMEVTIKPVVTIDEEGIIE